jgi:hypothetical protein
MTEKQNPHIGSTFESWLDEQGLREEVTAAAIKEVIAAQLAAEMKKKGITKARMAEMMETTIRPEKASPHSKYSSSIFLISKVSSTRHPTL